MEEGVRRYRNVEERLGIPVGGVRLDQGDLRDRDLTVKSIEEQFIGAAQALAVVHKETWAERAILVNYTEYLLAPDQKRKYEYLAQFLDWYGTKYTLPAVRDILFNHLPHSITTAIEFGPGTGWLIQGIEDRFPQTYAADRRPELFYKYPDCRTIFYNFDFESPGRAIAIPKDSLIIANQFLHCIRNWDQVIKEHDNSWWLIIEPLPVDPFPYWLEQMELFGAKPIPPRKIEKAMVGGKFELVYEELLNAQWISLWKPQ